MLRRQARKYFRVFDILLPKPAPDLPTFSSDRPVQPVAGAMPAIVTRTTIARLATGVSKLAVEDPSYCFTAMAAISTFAPPIKPATRTAARAGLGSGISAL
jgi:hypothetical protein